MVPVSPVVRHVTIKIDGDARELRRQLTRAELRTTRSFTRRLRLRYELWKLNRKPVP